MPRGSAATSSRFSAYARQFLEMMQKPDVEHIDGLSPAISIEQKTTSRNPRSTVATVTEIYDYMRLLWARVGVPYSPATGLPIERPDGQPDGRPRRWRCPKARRHYLLAPVVRGRKGEYRKELAEWQKAGFTRVRIDGEFYAIEDAPALDKKYKHDIEVVVDRIVVREGIETRLADSFETGAQARRGAGLSRPGRPLPLRSREGRAATAATGRASGVDRTPSPSRAGGERSSSTTRPPGRIIFSEKFACPVSGFTIAEIEPRLFSFNAPQGACPACDGLGEKLVFDEDLVVPNHSALDRARARSCPGPSPTRPRPYYMQVLGQPRPRLRLRPRRRRGRTCPRKRSDVILHGTSGRPVTLRFIDGRKQLRGQEAVRGRHRQPQPPHAPDRERLDARGAVALPVAPPVRGLPRRPPPPRAAGGQDRRRGHLACRPAAASPTRSPGSPRSTRSSPRPRTRSPSAILKEINERLGFLHNVGLDYLHLDRTSGTLSRRREPAHPPRQPDRLAACRACSTSSTSPRSASTRRTTTACSRRSSACAASATPCSSSSMTRRRSATPTMSSTWAPAPASTAARWSAHGTLDDLLACKDSLTADYLTGRREIPLLATRRKGTRQVRHRPRRHRQQPAERHRRLPARHLHLRHRGQRLAASRASPSTRSTPPPRAPSTAPASSPARTSKITGLEQLDKVIDIDQSPIGRTPRSNPATYTGAFTQIRDWFAGLPESKARGYKPGRFSLQRQGRPLRGVPGRRPDQDRDALPARRLRHLRRLPRRAATTARRSR